MEFGKRLRLIWKGIFTAEEERKPRDVQRVIREEDRQVVRKHIYFSGTVQGVGFRYRSYYIAQSLELTGWVKNLWDERVEMELQGPVYQIEEMLEQLHHQQFIEIEDMEVTEIPCVAESGFEIAN